MAQEDKAMAGADRAEGKDPADFSGGFRKLWEIIARLRAPDGCPWDREQTPLSVKKYLVEELYELLDALEGGDRQDIVGEMGDLFFMLLFVAYMLEEEGPGFSLAAALDHSARKMVRRHPHIFGDTEVNSTDDVVSNWQAIKAQEARSKGREPSSLGDIPKGLPALQRAFRLGERASRVGFDWPTAEAVWEKVAEEERELRAAMASGRQEAVDAELGDLLFTVANLARLLGVNPEEALRRAPLRFEERFRAMEREARRRGRELREMELEEMDRLWEEAKASAA